MVGLETRSACVFTSSGKSFGCGDVKRTLTSGTADATYVRQGFDGQQESL